MAELSKEEKAVLNTLVYINDDIWKQNGKKLDDVVEDLKSRTDWSADSGMSREEYEAVFLAVEKNPSLKQLEIVYDEEIDYKNYSEAQILTFKNGDTPVVVFHGTSAEGSEGTDNILGAFQADTDAQKGALEYINRLHDKYGYERISVTGHSKGGNKAMYVTVLSDYVTDCTAFDGQGFSPAFLEKYREQIQNKKDSIALISADRSIVNAFLFPIAGSVSYVSTEGLTGEETKLGDFVYHKPNVLFTVDAAGNVQFRAESTRKWLPILQQQGMVLFEKLAAEVAKRWKNASEAISTEIERLWGNLSNGMADFTKVLFGQTTWSMLQENIPKILESMAGYAFHEIIMPGISFLTTAGMAAFSQAVALMTTAFGAVYMTVKVFEFVIPNLLKAGVETAKAIGLAIGMAASWVGERLEEIGKAIVDGFHKAVDAAVRFFNWAKDTAKSVKDTVSNAVNNFVSGAGEFLGNVGKTIGNLIGEVFGSSTDAITFSYNILVIIAYIEELQRMISNLHRAYGDTVRLAKGAYTVTDRVCGYYNETYVRSCCRDIQSNLKNAQKYADMAQKELDRKRKALLAAIESYRGADRQAVNAVKNFA